MAEMMPSFVQSDDRQPDCDHISDSELPSGLPSPDASDDEDIRNCSDCGITTPYFFNKLREMTQPLFQSHHDLSPNGNTVCENVKDRSKSSRSKKRLGKENGVDSPAGIIERYYGYVPNPRWPKAYQAHTRPFNPKGIGKNDEAAIPGIIFRTKGLVDHSYQESDFPELNSLSKDDSSSYLGAHSHDDSITAVTKRLSLDNASQGRKSPVTSTPLRHQCLSSHDNSILDKSDVEEVQKDDPQREEPPNAKQEARNKSGRHNNRRRSKKIQLSPLVGNSIKPPDQSLSDSSDFNSSNSYLIPQGERSLEDLKSELNVAGKSQSCNEINNVITNTKCRSNRNSGSFQASPLFSHVQTSLSTFNEQRHIQDKDNTLDHSLLNTTNVEEKHGINNNIIKSPTWSQIASRGSSPVPWNNSAEGPCIRSSPSTLTVDTRPASPSWSQVIRSPVPSPNGFSNTKQTTGIASAHVKSEQITSKGQRSLGSKSQRKSSPAASAPQGSSFSGDSSKNNSRRKSGSKAPSAIVGDSPGDQGFSRETSKSPLLIDSSMPSNPSLSLAKAASLHSSVKSNTGKVISAETKRCSSSDNGKGRNTIKQTTERPCNSSNNKGTPRKGEKQRAKLMTLDNFMTPRKTDKENWPNHCSQDRDAFEKRFVEHIEVSATSPPKKVRPSPIKKLNFSFQEDKNSSSENDTTHGDSVEGKCDSIKDPPIYKRQVSLIRDFDWQKSDSNNEGIKKTNKGKSNSLQNRRSSGVVFSLEDYMTDKEAQLKDVVSEDEIDTVEQDGSTEKKVNQFWKLKPLEDNQAKHEPSLPNSNPTQQARDHGEEEIYQYYPKSSAVPLDSATNEIPPDTLDINKLDIADPSKVTFKAQLKKYARRYCHLVEEHQITSIADEIHFILQLLTPDQLNQETLKTVDLKVGGTTFRSVHNSVYFAVHVIKKLRRLFLCLPGPVLHLLAHNPRIKSFSPKLRACFLSALSSRKHENETVSPLDHNPFKTAENGVESFPDTNFAHVFKCQRDNFYALFRQYHDRNGIHPFSMEEQIQYVYDRRTPEQNAVTNLMHLAELYVEHLVQCCLSKADEQRKQMVELLNSQSNDDPAYERLFSEFLNDQIISPNGCLLASRRVRGDAFFVDFIQTLRCPAFNEHLKNLLASRILELNEKSFGCLRNLHSTVIIGDDKTPERCQDFSSTVMSLCAMAKILGHLVFSPYTSGAQDLPIYQEANMLRMREMIPLPLPLPLLLKQAFEGGHLSLTVPWIVDLLSMMDQAAPKLSVYERLLQHLHYLQKYAWKSLYMNGHHTSGLLIVSSISKLFQMAVIPSHLSVFSEKHHNEPMIEPQGGRHIDVQRLVSSDLLYFCCPHFVKSCEPLVVSVMYPNHIRLPRKVIPLIPKRDVAFSSKTLKNLKDAGVHQRNGFCVLDSDKRKEVCAFNQDEIKPDDLEIAQSDQAELGLPFASTQYSTRVNDQIQNKLKINLVDGTPYLRNAVNTTVDLLCGRVEEYTLNTLLKVGSFESKREVRSRFLSLEEGDDAERVKSQVLIHANMLAEKISSDIRYAFFQLGDRTCKKDLPQLMAFLTTCVDEQSRHLVIDIAEEIMVQRLQEWAHVQLGADFFRRIIVREAEKWSRSNSKPVTMFPTDFTQKLDQSEADLDLKEGFSDLQQLSEIMDRALSCGVWYINSLTPGPRPDENFMVTLINDMISCIDKRMVTIDFAFYVMANFLMHLIIQYIVDAPFNWSEACLESFTKLCQLCEDRKSEDDRLSIRLAETVRKTKNVKVKVYNLVSVFSLQWISKSLVLDHTLMVYCQTLARLVEVGLMMVETLIHKLMKARTNHHLADSPKNMIDRIMLKVLSLLYSSGCHCKTCSPTRIVSLALGLRLKLEDWGSDQPLEDLNTVFGRLIEVVADPDLPAVPKN